jgi:hypothetical protein
MRRAFQGRPVQWGYPMSLDIQSRMPLAVDSPIDDEAEQGMQRIEVALLVGATSIAIVLFSVVSVLIHLS